jgi:DNA-binding response OmpR family regulator
MLRRAGYRVDLIGEETNWSNTELAHSEIVILIGCDRRWIEQVCSAIKRSVPKLLLMVLGPDDVDSRVRLFELGADAYLAEQFDPAELLARITSLTRSQRCTL